LLKFLSIVVLLSVLGSQAAADQALGDSRTFDTPTLRLQAKAEEQYRNGHWERAYFIYVNDLAAVGDKYAQYMAGYMWHHGKGKPQDPVRASAWYRMAAERGAPEFVEVRDQLLESMSESERLASDQIYITLRQTYSDLVLALAQLRKEREVLNERPTGSRLSGSSSTVTIIDPRTGVSITRGEYVRRIETSMQRRLDYITAKIGIDTVEADMSDREFEQLVDQVNAYLQLIDDR
jgi:hypothetical protein